MNLGAKVTAPNSDFHYENLLVLDPEVKVNKKLHNIVQVMNIAKLNKFTSQRKKLGNVDKKAKVLIVDIK